MRTLGRDYHGLLWDKQLRWFRLGQSEGGVMQGINRGVELRCRHKVRISSDAETHKLGWHTQIFNAMKDTYLAGSVSPIAFVNSKDNSWILTRRQSRSDPILEMWVHDSTKHEEVDDCHGSGRPTNVGEGGGSLTVRYRRERGVKGSAASAERLSHGGEHSSIGVVRADGGDKKVLSRIIGAEGPHAPQAALRKEDKNRTKKSDPYCVNETDLSSISSMRAFV
ncbi:hypothetical protein ASPTUDRAFT_126811 [Aspergillus tubingensis CBS 134.48]|uniref:Uncharacterized protein n=1 Tax=Aspergillus tubingensis (strain CBS 134.48) TaxID=767770 RepID=A0A1L9MZA7_ASPTC|nr:hypothetical protein ASPTUDRAFT_126811 [Aspergillus tubingensis CBS 134.48]